MIVQRCKTLLPHILKTPSNHHFLQILKPISPFSQHYSTNTEPSTSQIHDFFLNKHKFSPKTSLKAANALSHLNKIENFDSVLSFLKKNGFSNTHLESLLNHRVAPQVLCSCVEKTLKPKIEVFRNVGFCSDDIACIISHDPWLLMHSAEKRILPNLLVLKNVLGSIFRVAKLLKVSAEFFRYDLETGFLPNVEFLKSCGIEMEQLIHHMFILPRAFLHCNESLRKYVERVDKMGIDKESKLYLYAIMGFSRMSEETWKKKVKVLVGLGFSEEEIMRMFRKRPHFVAASEGKMKEVVEVLLASGKYEKSDIVSHPGVFSASVENRLKPRILVCKMLQTLKLIEEWPAFSNLFVLSEVNFTKKFITPYLETLGDKHLRVSELLKQGHAYNIAVAVQS